MVNTYIDCIQYSHRAPTGIVLSNYIGNMGRISACAQGATSLTMPALTVQLNQYDYLYLFDGPQSEVLQVGSAGAAIGATSVPLQSPTQYAHNAGTPYCTNGTQGSLGEQIVTASQWVEDICYQSLWSATYTGEVLSLPTPRAALDNGRGMGFRPLHFPVNSLSALSIQTGNAASVISYDTTYATIDGNKRVVNITVLVPTSASQQSQLTQFFTPSLTRSTKAVATITYAAGYAIGSMPAPVQRACSLLTNQCFREIENPYGIDSQQQGKRMAMYTMRGDTTGKSLVEKQARDLLERYTVREY